MTHGRLSNAIRILAWIGLAVVIGIVPAALLDPRHRIGVGEESARPSATSIVSASGVTVTLPNDSFDLAYDEARGLVWLAVLDISDTDRLYAVSADGTVQQWPLPDSQHNGYLSQIKIDTHGVIWISQAYALTRFDPETNKATNVSLDEEAPNALPGALDPGSPLPGTWISALATVGDGVLVARNNVSALVEYKTDLEAVSTIRLPSEYAGARDLLGMPEGGLVALGGQLEIQRLATFSLDGTLLMETRVPAGVPESRLAPAGGNTVLVTGSPPSIVSLDDGQVEFVASCGGPTHATVAAIDERGVAVCYDPSTAAIRRDGDSQTVLAQLDRIEIEIHDQYPGGLVKVRTAPSLSEILVDKTGTVWFFVLGSHELRSATP